MVVLHYTAMADHDAAARVLCDPTREVSAHYLIGTDGTVLALVEEEQRAWHAGAGCWGDVTDVNSRSIGIELSNVGTCPFAAAQMDALCDLLPGILQRWQIPPHRVIGHSDMAPGRKIDPGARFDWRRLARDGLSIWPTATTPGDIRADLARFGYTANVDDDTLLSAFRLRFRPRHTGPLDDTDRALAADLARRFPVDATPRRQ
ncbi:N-acetylmuramoyl-L-alanine amidase [Loktanella sp. SALINAS62]|uniref:N-acetylmuramoyl-L-alanine amidase n=1 Tax=Loktanella sp. SALINAS62 TaxID=2706124 RepID=UPI001B8C0501|nr:N-acetylmuramoyl-L-alanine amidase [Loktanella sp. SALINAS62]MBS1303170.1 N-acetylmuramoyl-L-alanine amidase [Loktanella sp. SALINAS62]